MLYGQQDKNKYKAGLWQTFAAGDPNECTVPSVEMMNHCTLVSSLCNYRCAERYN